MRNITLYITILYAMVLSLNGCVDPFTPELDTAADSFVVVDGIITDQPGPYVVKINKSVPLNEVENARSHVAGLSVFIEEENGVSELLTETGPGIYETNTIQGVPGNRYRLAFDYGGAQYQSTWEEIEMAPEIDSVYFQVENKPTADKINELRGFQYYVDSHGDQNTSKNFRFEWEETWKISVTYRALHDYIGNDKVDWAELPLYDCWKYDSSKIISLASTDGFVKNVLSRHELPYITGEGERYVLRHSLLVKQFSVDDDEYAFWKAMKEANEQLGSLFDKQPGKVVGNISSSLDGEIVLGYFSASGMREKRIFVKSNSSISLIIPCNIELETLLKAELGVDYESILLQRMNDGRSFYRVISPPFQGVIGALLSDPRCTDCRLKGGYLGKPTYWDE